MLTRVLIVMLAVLNTGVVLWWWLRPQPVPVVPTLAANVTVLELLPALAQPAITLETSLTDTAPSVILEVSPSEETLELETPADEGDIELVLDLYPLTAEELPEAESDDTEAESEIIQNAESIAEISTPNFDSVDIATVIPVEEPPVQVSAEPEVVTPQCISLGPFTEMSHVQAALHALGSDVQRFRLREVIVPADTRYRILIPPAPSRAHAEAEVERIAAAGFSDYFIINDGEDTHAIALGQFRNRQGAQNRLTALRAAGFAAQLHTTTEVPHSTWWIDNEPVATITPAALQQRSNAAQWQALECAKLR